MTLHLFEPDKKLSAVLAELRKMDADEREELSESWEEPVDLDAVEAKLAEIVTAKPNAVVSDIVRLEPSE